MKIKKFLQINHDRMVRICFSLNDLIRLNFLQPMTFKNRVLESKIKIYTLMVLFSFLLITNSTYSQQPVNNSIADGEVGIFEHLDSIVPLYLKFQNEKNEVVTLRSLINKPTVLSFVYFDCPNLCSRLLEGVSNVVEKSDLILGKDYQIITVSFNYFDTPEMARQKKETFLLKHSKNNASSWIYLTGDSLNIYKLSNAVGFKFKRAGLDFIHPAAIMMLSPSGKITRYLYGISFLPFDLKMAVIEADKGLSRPTISRVLDFCFAYDPAGKRYAMDITKISGVLMLFILAIFGSVLIIRNVRQKKHVKLSTHN